MEFKGDSPMGFIMRGGLGLAAFLAFALWLYGCSIGTETEDPWQVGGIVEHQDGVIAKGARVTAIREPDALSKGASGDAPQVRDEPVDTVTDAKGHYQFSGLPEGRYTLYFDYFDKADSARIQARRIEGVYVHPRVSKPLGVTRLQSAAILTARVYNMLDNSNVEGAECRIDDTPYRATTMELGSLLLYALPGTYKVLCRKDSLLSQPYEVILDSGRPASADIPMSEGGLAVNVPMPGNVAASLDTNSGIVRVSWSKPAKSGFYQYRIRRLELEKIDVPEGTDSYTDTVWFDPVFAKEPDTVTSKLIQYNVSSKSGDIYSNTVSSKPLLVVRGPTAKVGFLETSTGDTLDPVRTNCAVGDTALLLGNYKSRLVHNSQVIWTMGADMLRSVKVDNRSGLDTLAFPCQVPGNPTVVFRVTDEANITLITAFKFEVVPAP